MSRVYTNAKYILAKHLSWEHIGQQITISDGNQRLYGKLVSLHISQRSVSARVQFEIFPKTAAELTQIKHIELAPHRLVGIGLEE